MAYCHAQAGRYQHGCAACWASWPGLIPPPKSRQAARDRLRLSCVRPNMSFRNARKKPCQQLYVGKGAMDFNSAGSAGFAVYVAQQQEEWKQAVEAPPPYGARKRLCCTAKVYHSVCTFW